MAIDRLWNLFDFDSMVHQQRRRHAQHRTIALRPQAGRHRRQCRRAAGRAFCFHAAIPDAVRRCQSQCPPCPLNECMRTVDTESIDHAGSPGQHISPGSANQPTRRTWRGQAPQLLGTHRQDLVSVQAGHERRIGLGLPVIAAMLTAQASTHENHGMDSGADAVSSGCCVRSFNQRSQLAR